MLLNINIDGRSAQYPMRYRNPFFFFVCFFCFFLCVFCLFFFFFFFFFCFFLGGGVVFFLEINTVHIKVNLMH